MPEIIHSAVPAYTILISFGAAVITALLGNRIRYLNEGITLAAAFIKFGLVFLLYLSITAGAVYLFDPVNLLPGVPFSLKVDLFGIYFAFLSSLLWIVTSIYSIGYMRSLNEPNQTRYYLSLPSVSAQPLVSPFRQPAHILHLL